MQKLTTSKLVVSCCTVATLNVRRDASTKTGLGASREPLFTHCNKLSLTSKWALYCSTHCTSLRSLIYCNSMFCFAQEREHLELFVQDFLKTKSDRVIMIHGWQRILQTSLFYMQRAIEDVPLDGWSLFHAF